jgi:hypothetical protein
VGLLPNVVSGPPPAEVLALHRQLPDQLHERRVVGVPTGQEAKVGDRLPDCLLPRRVLGAHALVEEDQPCGVALPGRKRTEVDQQRRREPVPGENVHYDVEEFVGAAVSATAEFLDEHLRSSRTDRSSSVGEALLSAVPTGALGGPTAGARVQDALA